MEGWRAESFGELNAEDYDRLQNPGTTEDAVALIAELAGAGRVLELAIGTGRVALPLARRGVQVEGMDASPEMLAKLKAKPGGDQIPVTVADMAEVGVDGPFDHIFLVFNTLFNLIIQDAQVRCFQSVAQRLAPGGTFLVETFVPDTTRFRDHQAVRVRDLHMGTVRLEAIEHDPLTQRLTHQRIHISPEGVKLVPLLLRYAYPPELDLMARLAGLSLAHRWGGWRREPFTAQSGMHVSVYQKPL